MRSLSSRFVIAGAAALAASCPAAHAIDPFTAANDAAKWMHAIRRMAVVEPAKSPPAMTKPQRQGQQIQWFWVLDEVHRRQSANAPPAPGTLRSRL